MFLNRISHLTDTPHADSENNDNRWLNRTLDLYDEDIPNNPRCAFCRIQCFHSKTAGQNDILHVVLGVVLADSA